MSHPCPVPKKRHKDYKGIRDTYNAFTIRLPPEMYAKVVAEAKAQRRSVAAQIQVDLERKYK